MAQQIDILIIVIGIVLVLWLFGVIVNRPKTPDHDIRRRALQIIAGVGFLPLSAVTSKSPAVTVVMVLTGAAVVITGLYLVLRSPPR